MDSIKPIENTPVGVEEKVEKYNEERIYAIINSGWDLIIIDEAHRVAGSSGEVARYKLEIYWHRQAHICCCCQQHRIMAKLSRFCG